MELIVSLSFANFCEWQAVGEKGTLIVKKTPAIFYKNRIFSFGFMVTKFCQLFWTQ